MPTIMFWNVAGGTALPYLQAACFQYGVDVLVTAEDRAPDDEALRALNSGFLQPQFAQFAPVPSDIRFYIRPSSGKLSLAADDGRRVSVRGFQPASGSPLLIAGAHLPSKLHANDFDQLSRAMALRKVIEHTEEGAGHSNTILVGDLNMDPYDPGMTSHDGLHSVMSKSIASRGGRTYGDQHRSFFYNPLWSRLGDESEGPPGTYYYSSSGSIATYWHSFDQVLIRPSLLAAYEAGQLHVVTAIGTTSLLKADKPERTISDHLPVVLTF